MKVNILIIISCLIMNVIAQAQDYEGIWHLTKVIQDNDTLDVSFEENSDYVDELTVYPESKFDTLTEVLFEANIETQLLNIGRNYYTIVGFDAETFEKRYVRNACYCSFYQPLAEAKLWYQFCEGSTILFEVTLKNETLYLEVLKKDTWKDEVFKSEIYIYERGEINIENDK